MDEVQGRVLVGAMLRLTSSDGSASMLGGFPPGRSQSNLEVAKSASALLCLAHSINMTRLPFHLFQR